MSVGGGIATDRTKLARPRRRAVFGVAITDRTQAAAIRQLQSALRTRRHRKIAFCNAHMANLAWQDARLRRTLADFTVFADGLGVDLAAWALHGSAFSDNLNGTDFVPALLAAQATPLRLALFGARPGVAERVAAVLARLVPQHAVTAIAHGYGDAAHEAAFLDRLVAEPADILLVALGNPAQEMWIARNIDARHATLAIGVGALFDFLSEEVKRAPSWLRDLRLEWLFRLSLEPRRLFGRYVLGNPLFVLRVLQLKLGLKRF